jgi:hypothetical protein
MIDEKKKAKFQRILQSMRFKKEMEPIVSSILIEEDPMRLIKIGAPRDEYSKETKDIVEHILAFQPTKRDVIRNFIYSTFTLSFCVGWDSSGRLALFLSPKEVRRTLGPKKDWDKIAQRVMEQLEKDGWIGMWKEAKKHIGSEFIG